MSVHIFVNNAESFLTDILIIGIERRSYLFNSIFADSVIKVVVNLAGRIREFLLADFALYVLDKLNHLLVDFMSFHYRVEHQIFRNFFTACLYHDNFLAAAGNSKFKGRCISLLCGRIYDDFAVNISYKHA